MQDYGHGKRLMSQLTHHQLLSYHSVPDFAATRPRVGTVDAASGKVTASLTLVMAVMISLSSIPIFS